MQIKHSDILTLLARADEEDKFEYETASSSIKKVIEYLIMDGCSRLFVKRLVNYTKRFSRFHGESVAQVILGMFKEPLNGAADVLKHVEAIELNRIKETKGLPLADTEFNFDALVASAPPEKRKTVVEGARAFFKAVQAGDERPILELIARAGCEVTAKPPGLQPHAKPPGAQKGAYAMNAAELALAAPEKLKARRTRVAANTAAYRKRLKQNKMNL